MSVRKPRCLSSSRAWRLWLPASLALMAAASPLRAAPCEQGTVFLDANGNGTRQARERGLPGIQVSDGRRIVRTDAHGVFRLPADGVAQARTVFVIKPAGVASVRRDDGLPATWRNERAQAGPALRYGGIPLSSTCPDFALARKPTAQQARAGLQVLVFADTQAYNRNDVDYYARDIIAPLASELVQAPADLGLALGDHVNDDLSLYPDMKRLTTSLGVPWLHAAGNHDLDFDADADAGSLDTFRHHFGPDTFAWEEPEANVVVLDNVVYRPGQRPQYIGGLRDDQFGFLETYLTGADPSRLLVLAMHMPLFEPAGRDTFRDADRERLFSMLARFPHVLLLTGHNHAQRHVFHGKDSGWHGATPLHEYNVGAVSGAYWSGVKDADGIPDATMADGTPNGYARLAVGRQGGYTLSWHAARGRGDSQIGLHAPRVLRRGAYPAYGVYANVYMGQDDTRVELRVDGGEWKPMRRVESPDPRLVAENVRDDEAAALRGYDRSPEAEPSPHLWRGALPTDLAAGEHLVEVRAFDAWQGEILRRITYRLEDPEPAQMR